MKIWVVICDNCKEGIYSRARHDFHYCHCGETAVDGGRDYLRVLFKRNPPIQEEIEIDATESDLIHDYNRSIDKFGWLPSRS